MTKESPKYRDLKIGQRVLVPDERVALAAARYHQRRGNKLVRKRYLGSSHYSIQLIEKAT